MAKYSTGDAGSDSGDSCELCGASDVDTQSVNVAGAQLQVCGGCAQHDDRSKTTDDSGGGRDRKKRAAQNTARMHDATRSDPTHWEDGADYDERLTEARQEAGYQLEELADELGIDDADLLALEQARATQAGVGGSVVATLEEFLGVTLVEE